MSASSKLTVQRRTFALPLCLHNRERPIWRVCQAVPLLAILAVSAWGAGAKPKPVLTFSLTATNEHLAVHPERGFILGAWRIPPNDRDVDVSLAKDGERRRGFLLYGPLYTRVAHLSDENWSPHRVPGPSDRAVVTNNGRPPWQSAPALPFLTYSSVKRAANKLSIPGSGRTDSLEYRCCPFGFLFQQN